jgi:hypothetical protein
MQPTYLGLSDQETGELMLGVVTTRPVAQVVTLSMG